MLALFHLCNMSIRINHNNIEKYLQIGFDSYGNVYLYFDSLDKAYQLNVNGKNIPYLEPGQYNIIKRSNKNIGTFTILDSETSLKSKVDKHLEEEHAYDSDDDYDLDGDNISDYYPEDSTYLHNDDLQHDDELIDENMLNAYGDDNLKFNFWSFSKDEQISIYDIENEDIMALYDTYIYDNGQLIFKSNSKNGNSIYRLCIHLDGTILFRPIGYTERIFNILINSDNTITLNHYL